MAVVLTVPPEIALQSHTKGVRLQGLSKPTPAVRRAVVTRFEVERSNYPSIHAFAVAESARLEREGIAYPVANLTSLIKQRKGRLITYPWERVLTTFRSRNSRQPFQDRAWFDVGDLATATGIATAPHVSTTIRRLRLAGHEIRRRRAPWASEQARGWKWEYRLWEAGA